MADARRKVRFGVQSVQQHVTWDELLTLWQEVEVMGFDTAWVFDHVIPMSGNTDGPCLEGWSLLAALAAHTTRIRIGTMVTGNTYRNPAMLAKIAATVDIISGGRLEMGIGGGWFELEHRAYGIPYPPVGERLRRLDEALAVIKALWTQERPGFQGRYYHLEDAPFAPKPVQKPHPPILIGGGGERVTLRIAAKWADEWNGFGSPTTHRHKAEVLAEHCAAIGRDPATIERSVLVPMTISDDRAKGERMVQAWIRGRRLSEDEGRNSVLVGTAQEMQEQIGRYIDVGVTHIILTLNAPYNYDMLRRFAQEVIPAFR